MKARQPLEGRELSVRGEHDVGRGDGSSTQMTLGFNRVLQTQGDSDRDRKTRRRAGHKARYRQSGSPTNKGKSGDLVGFSGVRTC